MIGLYVINSTSVLTGLTEKRLYSYYCIYDLRLQLHRPTIYCIWSGSMCRRSGLPALRTRLKLGTIVNTVPYLITR